MVSRKFYVAALASAVLVLASACSLGTATPKETSEDTSSAKSSESVEESTSGTAEEVTEYTWEDNVIKVSSNMLINGNAENGLEGWITFDDAWGVSAEVVPCEGSVFFWPRQKDVAETYMYQDVSLKGVNHNGTLLLTGWLCNWNQPPNDCARLVLELLDENGGVIASYYREQRNPQWNQHAIFAAMPANVVTARVKLVAIRYVGLDNDAYFDDLSLTAISQNITVVTIQGNTSTALAGDKITLVASNGLSANPQDYLWSSSYDSIATVDEYGVVTFYSGDEVVIYAKDKATGIEASYIFNQKTE